MTLEIQLRNAPIKPDAILRSMAGRFRFEIVDAPRRFFDMENHSYQATEINMFYKGGKHKARLVLEKTKYGKFPAYLYRYEGPAVDEGGKFNSSQKYNAYVVFGGGGCFSCGGMRIQRKVIRDEDTPEWFPIED